MADDLRTRLSKSEEEASELNKLADGLSQSKAQLIEQVKGASLENTSLTQRLSDEENAKQSALSRLEAIGQERTLFQERCLQISPLETSLSETHKALNELKELHAALREEGGKQIAELQAKASIIDDLNRQLKITIDERDAHAKEVVVLKDQHAALRENSGKLGAELQSKVSLIEDLNLQLKGVQNDRETLSQETSLQKATIAELKTTIESERVQSVEKLNLLNEAREHLSNQFKALANEIIEEVQKIHRAESREHWATTNPTKTTANRLQNESGGGLCK